jgi:hypothetical protein
MFFNRLIVFIKRILSSKLYLAMMVSIIVMSVIYALLPARVKSTDIRVALYMDTLPSDAVTTDTLQTNDYGSELYSQLKSSGSVYTYCLTDSLEELREGVESGKFECGFYIPEGFFNGYIAGSSDCPKIIRYETASTTLGSAITESVFSRIFRLCAADILYVAYDNPESNGILLQRLNSYLNGDRIFQIEDHSANLILDEDVSTPVNLPVRQLALLLIIFSGLLGLLMYVGDNEKNIYIVLSAGQKFSIRLTALLGSVIPMFLVSLVCCLVTYRNPDCILPLLISAVCVVIFAYFPGILFKKRSSLARLLPVIMLILIPFAAFL